MLTPEELAWEMSAGRVALILEPVPLFDRAMSATLEYLAGLKARQDASAQDTAVQGHLPGAENPAVASQAVGD